MGEVFSGYGVTSKGTTVYLNKEDFLTTNKGGFGNDNLKISVSWFDYL
jgi:hypothetical protein